MDTVKTRVIQVRTKPPTYQEQLLTDPTIENKLNMVREQLQKILKECEDLGVCSMRQAERSTDQLKERIQDLYFVVTFWNERHARTSEDEE